MENETEEGALNGGSPGTSDGKMTESQATAEREATAQDLATACDLFSGAAENLDGAAEYLLNAPSGGSYASREAAAEAIQKAHAAR